MSTGDPGGAADDFHRVADEAVRCVVHAESHVDIGQVGHVVFGKLFLDGAKESPICCAVLLTSQRKAPTRSVAPKRRRNCSFCRSTSKHRGNPATTIASLA